VLLFFPRRYSYSIVTSIRNRGDPYFNGPKEPDFEENFYILKHTKCPAVLTENFFMDNVEDVRFLESREGKNALSLLHVEGIAEYFNR